MYRIGIDIGGTFTDFVFLSQDTGELIASKLLTDNENPATTVLKGLREFLSYQTGQIIHGSTVATNALLERKGAITALVTTRGFKDIIQIGRQNRPNLYDWNQAPAPSLIPPEFRFEIKERVNAHGHIQIPLDVSELPRIIEVLRQSGIESVAVALLFSFLYPDHERTITNSLREAGFLVSSSCEILPEYREYERTSTTAVNAYVSPILDNYLSVLQDALPNTTLQMMQSNGGMIDISEARKFGVRCILSGPAGGIVGAQYIAHELISTENDAGNHSILRIITFDMGGTSTDVSLIDGNPTLTTDAIVGGCPIHLPLLDIHTIGAGGGSIAYMDAGRSLRVGPQSAGADPGPACYGKGEFPTVTDANLELGRILPGYFLGGRMPIYPERAKSSLEKLGRLLDLTPAEVAQGIIDIVNIQMERALRVISVERGYDPAQYSLFSFGGAGGLHACELAHQLGIPRVIIPRLASTLSAFGMLVSDVIKDYVKTVMLPGHISLNELDERFSPMIEHGLMELEDQEVEPDRIKTQCSLDMRYSGQSYELNTPFTPDFIGAFHAKHSTIYGYSMENKEIEIVNLRLRVIGQVPPVKFPRAQKSTKLKSPSPPQYTDMRLNGSVIPAQLFHYGQLNPGDSFHGPALIASSDTTILVNPGDIGIVDDYLNLIISIQGNKAD
jgi:N-methylhydantoinase A